MFQELSIFSIKIIRKRLGKDKKKVLKKDSNDRRNLTLRVIFILGVKKGEVNMEKDH